MEEGLTGHGYVHAHEALALRAEHRAGVEGEAGFVGEEMLEFGLRQAAGTAIEPYKE